MASADEMYLRCCLESVHNSALKASQHNKPVSLNTVKFVGEAECDSGQLVLGHSVAVSNNASDNWTLGTVMGTKSMINILNSPLLQHFGASEGNDNLNSMNFTDAKNMTCYDFKDSPSSSYKLEMETPMVQSHEYDDQKEVYVAKLSKVDTTHDEDLDYVYLFHLNKGCEIPDRDLQLVEMYTSRHSHMKNKGMAKKASKVLRHSPSLVHITLSKFNRSKAIRESCSLGQQSCGLDETDLLETNVPTNFELAAIVVKDHLPSHDLDKGSSNFSPTLRMVNVHDGLYFIDHFQPSLSALPSFSIAVVIIHTQSPTLEPNNAQEL
ncbi:hypothetical protein JHK87_027976 [Glycine soja]|nr:hypothetical protein JHK87_027976 [Glycine soja]